MIAGQEKIGYELGQISLNAVRAYEKSLVPALFRQWAPQVAHAANIRPKEEVIDVACGTGVLADYIQKNLQAQVTGLDFHFAMLSIAAETNPTIRWDQGKPELLPYNNNSFDAAVSQFGLSFLQNADDVIKEMIRVVRPGRTIAIAVWDRLESSPLCAALRLAVAREFGETLLSNLKKPFTLGSKEKLLALFLHPGLHFPDITSLTERVSFPSMRSWISSQIRGWLLSDLIPEKDLVGFIPIAEKQLAPFAGLNGRVELNMQAHLLTSVKEQID